MNYIKKAIRSFLLSPDGFCRVYRIFYRLRGVDFNSHGPTPTPRLRTTDLSGRGIYLGSPAIGRMALTGYFSVPGIWEPAPEAGLLWTPGYWGWSNGYYIWHEGYWAGHVGFYGGINYGHGYGGVGYEGGYWNEGRLYYNSAVTNVNVAVIHTTYQAPANENPVRHHGQL